MSKITKDLLEKIIQEELKKALDEDALVSPMSARKDNYRKSSTTCEECGYSLSEDEKTCEQCGTTNKNYLNEGDCGCNECEDCGGGTVVIHKKHAGSSHHGAYMSKSQLYKVAKYAQKLYYMIPDNYNLEDWMRTKLAQIADDLGEVYHALDHDIFEGDI